MSEGRRDRFRGKKPPKIKPTMQMRQEIEHLQNLKSQLVDMNTEEVKTFSDLPISRLTLEALTKSGFTVPTKVQRQSLIYSLGGCDVVAAAKTGSGKTLAFIIPLLEKLYCDTWTAMDGLGALVVTPTRELAYQIFDVLNKVGKGHRFSAGLVIGGTDLKFEWQRVSHCNIMICTPGRLVQHMTENPEFQYEYLQIVVFDEADMCLSMGFSDDMNFILDEIPKTRQTLLFSATQTRNVKDLIRAGCKQPVFCSVHEHSKTSTPKSLVQSYVVCPAHEKFQFLYDFVSHHKKNKILVFLATCKQVKYVNNMFCKLQPGLSVMSLHGDMKQLKRLAIFDSFSRKKTAVLFATDIAARGWDIPAVHWVVQADCPEDVDTYIHRAGRTARYSNSGDSLLVLTPSEEPAMVQKLKARNIPIERIEVDESKKRNISTKMDIILTRFTELKEDAVRAYKAYLKDIAFKKDKKVFNILSFDHDAYARSLGLIFTPRTRFLEKLLKQKFGDAKLKGSEEGYTTKSTMDFGTNDSDDDDDDGFLKSSGREIEIDESIDVNKPLISKKKQKRTVEEIALRAVRKNIVVNTKITFDDDGNELVDGNRVRASEIAKKIETTSATSASFNIEELKEIMKEEDQVDKKIHKEKLKAKKREKKMKEKEKLREEMEKAKECEEVDMVEGESESDDYDDEATKAIIDALPDPDKIYNKQDKDSDSSDDEKDDDKDDDSDDDSDEDDSSEEESEDEEAPTKFSGKRKARLKMEAQGKRTKLDESGDLGDLPMDEQEQLALFLLSGKK